ncbi:MAG TPA: methyltransferase domain-containing protein [Candidatus Methanoperedens sp.]|nr:methyltransferase domain-containing protein [Candidatus Methanoperedens sp.]
MRREQVAGTRGTAQTIAIERLAAGGDGVGRVGGKTVFVPLSAPGDIVAAEIVEERRTFCRARLLRVVTPSPDRAEPSCPHFGTCGGCSWQHLAYPAQLAAKRAIVADALRRIGGLDPPSLPPTLASPLVLGYRHRARLHAVRAGDAVRLGFFRAGSRRIVPIQSCPVLHLALNIALGALAAALRRPRAPLAPGTEVRIDTDWEGSTLRLTLHGPGGAALRVPAFLDQALREAAAPAGIAVDTGGDRSLPLRLGPDAGDLVTTGATFTQVNLAQNRALVATALDLAGVRPGDEVLDLCCGLGNLAVPAAARGARVLGVDLDGEAVRQARDNARRAAVDATFVRGDAAAGAAALAAEGRRFDLVLLNPPRAGARAACAALTALAPARIVVVSCDPATLARDAAVLAAGGLRLAAAQPLDLFPQTAHVETVARFDPDPRVRPDPAAQQTSQPRGRA